MPLAHRLLDLDEWKSSVNVRCGTRRTFRNKKKKDYMKDKTN
jgi:hypothetical protein